MDDLIVFLRARLDEDEAKAKAGFSHPDRWVHVGPDIPNGLSCTAVLAEVDAKRQIIGDHRTKVHEAIRGAPEFGLYFWCETCHVPGDEHGRNWCRTLRLLALPYADHPAFQEEWRP